MQSSVTTLILKSKWKIVITDYIDYPVLHITIKYTGFFSRKFSVVLHASLAKSFDSARFIWPEYSFVFVCTILLG